MISINELIVFHSEGEVCDTFKFKLQMLPTYALLNNNKKCPIFTNITNVMSALLFLLFSCVMQML